jgi:hypothetical protein
MTQIVLTLLILWATVFLLGFVAEPIVKLYLDPVATLTTNPWTTFREPLIEFEEGEEWTWSEHLLKGFASLGLLGLLKSFIMSPFQWLNLRWVVGGSGRARRGGTGRERLEDISVSMIIIGVATILYVSLPVPSGCSKTSWHSTQAIWKGVRAWSRNTLEKAGERVVDVHGEDDDDEEPDAGPSDAAESGNINTDGSTGEAAEADSDDKKTL